MSSKPKGPSLWLLVPNKKTISKMPPKYKGKPPRDLSRPCGGFSKECRVEEPIPGAQSRHHQVKFHSVIILYRHAS
jgi:hypothetical protein